MTEQNCNCFICQHKNEKEQIAYLTGYIESCEEFIKWAHENKLRFGDLGKNDLNALYTQIYTNYIESLNLREDILTNTENNK